MPKASRVKAVSAKSLFAVLLILFLLPLPTPAQDTRWRQLAQQVKQLYSQGKYDQALAPAQESLRIAAPTYGPQSRQVATSLNDLAMVLEALDRYPEAETSYKRALALNESTLGPQHTEVASNLNNLGLLYLKMDRLPEARALLERALSIREKALGPDNPDTATNAGNLGTILIAQGKYAEAEPLEKRVLASDQKASGPASDDVATDLNNLGSIYFHQAKYAQAEPLYTNALSIHLKLFGNEHPSVALDLTLMGALLTAEKKYTLAEATYQRALAIDEKALGPERKEVAEVLNSLASLYYAELRYQDAEPAYRRALAIRQKALGAEHPLVAATLSGLARLKKDQGQYPESEALYRQALAIDEKALGPEHTQVARLLNGLGDLYMDVVRVPLAAPLFQRAFAIDQKNLGPESPQVAADLNELALVADAGGNAAQAAPLYERIVAIQEKTSGPMSSALVPPLLNLGSLRQRERNFAAAETLEKRALTILQATAGPNDPDTRAALLDLAITYYGSNRTDLAATYFDQALTSLTKQIDSSLTYMSERQRLQFLATEPGAFPLLFSFAVASQEHDPTLPGKMYDAVLYEKGLVASSAAALRARILDSGDTQAVTLFDQLTAKRTQLAELASAASGDADWRKAMAQLDQEANAIETDLVKRSAALADAKALARLTWHDVQKALKPNDAAVEYVRFPVHNGVVWMHTDAYAALVLTPSGPPRLLLLGNAQKLEGDPVVNYRAEVARTRGVSAAPAKATTDPGADAGAAYTAFWKPLEGLLGTADRVYVAADGILNQVPIGLFSDSAGKLLLEKYDLRLVNSTKDLLRPQYKGTGNTAVMVGNPAFEGTLPPLPATQAEVEAIALSLKTAGWQVSTYTGNMARKEVLEKVRSPRVVHLATHGFFYAGAASADKPAKPSAVQDPMLRSGLFFAGAVRNLDGVLTAYEASQLHLQGTQLVVLSACETGLGQQANGEGVFGLRRGLQEAGAESVLMSMWSVPDRETQELMTIFYQQWLGGLDEHEALRRAQLKERDTVRQRYGRDLPYYWGAFVLIGR